MRTRLLLIACVAATVLEGQTPRDTPDAPARAAVRRAALDYLEGFYEGDTAKLLRSLHPRLFKYGFFRDTAQRWSGEQMTLAEALDYARRVRSRNRPVPATWPKDVQVFEVLDRTAAAKVTAWWGSDYLLVGNFDGQWQITHVLWEGPLKRDVRRELTQRYIVQDSAIARRELPSFLETLAPDYTVILQDGRRFTRPGIDSAIARDMRAMRGARLVTTEIEQVQQRGDTAIAVVVHRGDRDLADARGNVRRVENAVRHEETWVRAGGVWRIVKLLEREQLLLREGRT